MSGIIFPKQSVVERYLQVAMAVNVGWLMFIFTFG
jgi:hypothetical protein